MRLTEEQKELQDTVKAFFREKITSAYLRKRCEESAGSDSALWTEITNLGLFDFFTQGTDSGSMVELGLIAFESGFRLLPEFLIEHLFAGPYFLAHLSKEERQKISDKFGADVPPEIEAGRKRVVYASFEEFLPAFQNVDFILLPEGRDKLKLFKVTGKGGSAERAMLDRTLKYGTGIKPVGPSLSLRSRAAAVVQAEFAALSAAMLAGAAARALEMSAEHASTRRQFEQPISSFQAIRHHLADMLIKVEALTALSSFACFAAAASEDQTYLAAHSALRYALEAAPQVAEQAIQVHGGIGFTWEYDLHLYLRRIKSSEALFSFIKRDEYNDEFLRRALNS